MRVSGLERSKKQLSDEYTSLKERTRYSTTSRSDPNSEVGLIRKENDRLLRLNSNLTKSLEANKQELEDALKKLKKQEGKSVSTAEYAF
jgi:hypothetical protein